MNKTNLFYYAKPWEAFACVFFFSAIVIAILLDVPSSEEFLIQEGENSGIDMSWNAFVPPVDVTQYVLMRCADVDGDTDITLNTAFDIA